MKTFTKRLLTHQTKQTQTTESVHMTTTSSAPCLLPTLDLPNVDYFRFLYVSSSSVKTPLSWQVDNLVFIPVFMTSRQFGIHSCLQCVFQSLVHGIFLEIIMLLSTCSKDSRYPTSRSRVTMELSPHPNDMRVRSLHMSVSWQVSIPIVKDDFLAVLLWFIVIQKFLWSKLRGYAT